MSRSFAASVFALASGGLFGAWVIRRVLRDAQASEPPSSRAGARSGASGLPSLNGALLSAGVSLIPPGTVLRPGDAALDPVYGGRRGTLYGAPVWAYYQTLLDANGRKGGTTCGVALAYLMGRAGWPADMVNRLPSDATAPGGGTTPGAAISKIVGGAKRRGWYRAPSEVRTGWQSGDAYHVDHPPKANSDHVGMVAAVFPAASDGTVQIETIDGGQGSGADLQRSARTLSADGKTLTRQGVPARVLGVIRAGEQAVS